MHIAPIVHVALSAYNRNHRHTLTQRTHKKYRTQIMIPNQLPNTCTAVEIQQCFQYLLALLWWAHARPSSYNNVFRIVWHAPGGHMHGRRVQQCVQYNNAFNLFWHASCGHMHGRRVASASECTILANAALQSLIPTPECVRVVPKPIPKFRTHSQDDP